MIPTNLPPSQRYFNSFWYAWRTDGTLLSEYNGVSGKQLLNEDLKVWGDSLNSVC